ncbi:hypothetical protein CPC08DRAFT_701807 [Agrocybe pediades]|nr:hypothetical protein CPC08DRAFT_701807 [Agrocybe pediades]
MSVYSQNMYGQPSYTSSSYGPPPPAHASYYYNAPPPQPPAPATYALDAIAFRRDYNQRLTELTFNSRGLIQHLSMLAQEYSRYSDIVAQCLEAHIRRVPPWMKLPAWYLLDAISKNVYEPYARKFSGFVVPLFLETYPLVDSNTRSKMEEMLLTWRTGSPSGKELFGVQQQVAVERGVWGNGASGSSSANFHSGPGIITKSQVLSELQFTLGQKERALQANPYDTLSQNHIAVLNQLRMHVEAGVSQDELRQILGQLRNLVKNSPPPVAQLPPPPPPQPLPPTVPPAWSQQPTFPPHMPPSNIASTSTAPFIPPLPVAPVVNNAQPPAQPAQPPAPAVTADSINNLLSTLIKAGVVSTNGTPTGAGATAKEQASPEDSAEETARTEAKDAIIRGHREAILAESVNLLTLESVASSRIVDFLYERQGLQCKQCGIRFPDSKSGKKEQDDHLDMHFRQNRKANENLGRGHSRSWFIGVDDWIQDVSVDVKGKGRAHGSGRFNAKAAVAAEKAKQEADLRAQYVVAPPENENQVISCPICKESLALEFLEEEEEWAWRNATKKDGKVYHATCYAEAMASTNTLAARLRTEQAHGSRSATPEVQVNPDLAAARSTPPDNNLKRASSRSPTRSPSTDSKLAGTKRKVGLGDDNVTQEASGTPPLKKIALSVP